MNSEEKKIPFGWIENIEERKTVYVNQESNDWDIQIGKDEYQFDSITSLFLKINLENLREIKNLNGFVVKIPFSVCQNDDIPDENVIIPGINIKSGIYIADKFNEEISFDDFKTAIDKNKFINAIKSENDSENNNVTRLWVTTIEDNKKYELNFEVSNEINEKIQNNELSITFMVNLKISNPDDTPIDNTTSRIVDISRKPSNTIIMSFKGVEEQTVQRNEILGGMIEEINYKTGETNFVIPTINHKSNNSIFRLSGFISPLNTGSIFGAETNINIDFKIRKINSSVIIVKNFLNKEYTYFKKRDCNEYVNYQKGIESIIIESETGYTLSEGNFSYILKKQGNTEYRLLKTVDKYTRDETNINWDYQTNKSIISNNYGDAITIERDVNSSIGKNRIKKIVNNKDKLEFFYIYNSSNQLMESIKVYYKTLLNANHYYNNYIDEVNINWIKLGTKYYIRNISNAKGESIKYDYEYSSQYGIYILKRKTVNNGLEIYQEFKYYQDKTTITDNFLGSQTLYFDKMGQLANIRDDNSNYTETHYNFIHYNNDGNITYSEKRITNNISKNYLMNGDFLILKGYDKPNYFDLDVDKNEDIIVDNNLGFKEFIGEKLFYISKVKEEGKKIKTINQKVNVDKIHKKTTYLFSFWYYGNSPNDLQLLIDGKAINYTITEYDNLFKYVTATFIVEEYTDQIDFQLSYSGKGSESEEGIYFGGLRLTKVYGTDYKFNNNGQLTNTEKEKIEYDEKKNIKSVETENEKLIFEYNNKNKLKSIYDEKSSYKVDYDYDNFNNVISEIQTDKKGKTKTFNYNYTNQGSLLESSSNSRGFKRRYFYDEHKRLTSQTDESGLSFNQKYDHTNKVIESSFQLNNQIEEVKYEYNNNVLKSIYGKNISRYDYYIDENKRLKEVRVDNNTIKKYNYNKVINGFKTDLITETTHPDNSTQKFEYNDKGELLTIKYNDILKYSFEYDTYGRLVRTKDLINKNSKYIRYSDIDTISGFSNHSSNMFLDSYYSYDNNKRLISRINYINNEIFNYYFNDYKLANKKEIHNFVYYKGVSGPENPAPLIIKEYTEGKLTKHKIASRYNILEKNYEYNDNSKTNSITEDYGQYKKIYTFDEMGNIIHIVKLDENNNMLEGYYYEYDEFKRLTKEEKYNSSNELISKITYKYDNNGNILEKNNHLKNEKLIYQYNNQIKTRLDKVIKHTSTGTTNYIDYNYDTNMFNPNSYIKNNKENVLEWQGSNLVRNGDITYKYDESGIRIEKNSPTESIKYLTEGNKVIRSIKNNIKLTYHYDENDMVIGFRRLDKEYFYDRDLIGNIVSIIDSNGIKMINYEYTAYGIPKISLGDNLPSEFIEEAESIINENIILYKGYIYDYDIKMYYCESRYFDPEIGRWLSIDDINYLTSEIVNGLNLYAYCLNNPVMYIDRDGNFPILISLAIIFGIGALSGVAGTFIGDLATSAMTGEWSFSSWETYAGSAIGYGIGALFVAGGMPTLGLAIGSGLSTFAGMSLEKTTGTSNASWGEIALWSGVSAGLGALMGHATKGLRVSGITAGRGSFQHVMRTQFTNMLRHGYNISLKTSAKSFVAMTVSRQITGGFSSGLRRAAKEWWEYFMYGDSEGLGWV